MPRKPLKRLVKGNRNSLAVGALEQLILGYDPFFDEPLPEVKIEALYRENKAFIMSLIGQNIRETVPGWFVRGIPIAWGTRPAAWWSYDSPGPRRILRGDPGAAIPGSGFSFGRPRLYRSLEAFNSTVFESQPEYLTRLNLLMPGELEKIKPGPNRI